MTRLVGCTFLLLLALVGSRVPGAESQTLDLRRAAPADAYLVVHGRHNPERDYQRAYLQEVIQTVRETQLVEKIVQIATKRMAEDDLEKAKAVWDEIKQAVDPVDGAALIDAQEVLYAQSMRTTGMPTAQHLLMARLTAEAAGSMEKAVQNLLDLVNKYSEGKVSRQSASEGEATITTIPLPPEAPFSPTLIRLNDVIVFSSSGEWARQALSMLSGQGGESKFDDPRLKEALSHLPEPEDSIVFYDAKLQFEQMRGIGQFIRQASGGNPQAERVVGLLELLFSEAAIMDYEVTVEYTEGNLNRSAVYGKLLPQAEEKVLTKVFASGQPFAEWHRWVPADALAYSLGTGANLHPLYQGVMEIIKERFPERKRDWRNGSRFRIRWTSTWTRTCCRRSAASTLR